MSNQNKEIVKKAQALLKDLGHNVPVGHLYEVFSKLSGHKSWNVASAKKVAFAEVVRIPEDKVFDGIYGSTAVLDTADPMFSVKIIADAEVKKYYRLSAKNEAEAKAAIQEYINAQCGEIEESEIKFEQTRELLKQEDAYQFSHDNWEIRDNSYMPTVSEVYPEKKKTKPNT